MDFAEVSLAHFHHSLSDSMRGEGGGERRV